MQRLLLDAKIVVGNVQRSRSSTLGKLCDRKGDRVVTGKNAVCVLIAYDENWQKITTGTVDRAAVKSLIDKALVMD
jgi:hypothetical protein